MYTILSYLNTSNLDERINRIVYRNKWHGHVLRLEPKRIAQRTLQYKATGQRDVGRPGRIWEDFLRHGTGQRPIFVDDDDDVFSE
jgi:hypothetical protein